MDAHTKFPNSSINLDYILQFQLNFVITFIKSENNFQLGLPTLPYTDMLYPSNLRVRYWKTAA